jgi:peptidyl-prolyl isomerase E (cyclophilin E)
MNITITRKNILYVGGLHDTVTEDILHAAFIPFGDLKSIQMPRDFTTSKSHNSDAFAC